MAAKPLCSNAVDRDGSGERIMRLLGRGEEEEDDADASTPTTTISRILRLLDGYCRRRHRAVRRGVEVC